MYSQNFCLFWCFCLHFCPLVMGKFHSDSDSINLEGIQGKLMKELGGTVEGINAALSMLDASSKIPGGVLAGNFYDLGHFDECYAIEYEEIYGKYCLGTLTTISKEMEDLKSKTNLWKGVAIPQPRTSGPGLESFGLHFAACVPSNWSAGGIPSPVTYTEDFCYSKGKPKDLSTGAIVLSVILSIFSAIIAASTIFDVILYYTAKEPPHELLTSFSFLSNGRKIFQSSSNPEQLLCLNGIKAISMMWVIYGHEHYLASTVAPISNLKAVKEWKEDPANMFVNGANIAVDSFFVVGGLVTVYTFLKSMDRGVKFNVALYYIHRYLRLTPVFVILALFHMYLLNYLAEAPLWKTIDLTLVQDCRKNWWSSFLYITNYIQEGNCLPQTWYLTVDMQLFILSPTILVPLKRWPKIGLSSLGVLSVFGCFVPFALTYWCTLKLSYVQTYMRFGPYVIGMISGYSIYKIKKGEITFRLKPLMVILLWLVVLTGLAACLYAGYPLTVATEPDRWGNSMFLAFNRNAWGVSLSGVILLCVSGYGGFIDKFLSLPLFQILAKLSYSMYLTHYTVISVRYATMKNGFDFSNIYMVHAFWGDFMITLVLSLIMCLSFESPVIILEKYLFGRTHKKESKKKKVEV